jgi:mono/diheme cytochrome c family protein
MTNYLRMASAILLAASFAGPIFAQGTAAADYKAKCVSCHGADGLAATPVAKAMKILSFKDPSMIKASDAQLIDATKNGKGKMPAYAGKLTDAQISDVVKYIRTLQK